jgi:hypothetical protein
MSAHTARVGRLVLGLLWLVDGALQFQPYMFGRTFVTGILLPNAAGQPGFIQVPIIWVAGQIEPHVALFNALAASLQVLIGIGLLHDRTAKPALITSFVWAGLIWLGGEGAGMLLTGTASPQTGAPGAALLYLVAGAMVWPREHTADVGFLGERGAQLAWGVIWLSYAVLWLLPANSGPESGAQAILSGVIGLAVMCSWHRRAFLAVAICLAFVYWAHGQAFGGVFTGQSTDVGTGPPLMLIGSLLMFPAPRQFSRLGFRHGATGAPRTS